ncbi:MAG: NTP transferase domain-containing protein [Candidatus Lokiarchaeota archaeon]|nr:NTP transferase domain-containing protein [Candidatus Lokiarchaeota archaeon]
MNLISFVLLSGGPSSRMGKDKGLVKLGDKLLIQHVLDNINKFRDLLNLESKIPVKLILHDFMQQQEYLDRVPELTEDDIIIDEVVWNSLYSDIPLPPQCAMLGVWTAMTSLRNKYRNVFVLPGDAPFVSEAILSYMMDEYFKTDRLFKNGNKHGRKKKVGKKYISYVPQWNNHKYEPIFAIYHIKSIQPALERRLLRKEISFQRTIEDLVSNKEVLSLNEIRYNVEIRPISIEQQFSKYDGKFDNFIDINSFENLKSVEKKLLSREIKI